MKKSKVEHRVFEVKPLGNKGHKIKARYYDTDEYKIHEAIFDWTYMDSGNYITPTIEVIPEKYNFSPQGLLDVLHQHFPKGRFIIKKYGSKKSEIKPKNNQIFESEITRNERFVELPSQEGLEEIIVKDSLEKKQMHGDIDHYLPNERSIIIWHLGDREDKNDLEFFIDEKKKKQIFIRNSPKRFLARTEQLNTITLENKKEHIINKYINSNQLDISEEEIQIKKNFIQLKLTRKELEKLRSEKYFRIFEYVSKSFTTEKQALEHKLNTLKLNDINTYVDKISIINDRDSENKINYYIKLSSSKTNENFLVYLSKLGYKENRDEYSKMQILKTREEKWDPLDENTATGQLRDFFPIHMPFYPGLSPVAQANSRLEPFSDIPSNGNSELEEAINDAFNFYKKNTVIIDLETIDWKQGVIPSGRIYMAVLRSETENKLYISKEIWNNEKLRIQVEEKYKDYKGKIEFFEDEIELISQLNQDAKKYEYILGHNYRDYDHKHLTKFNNESKLFKHAKINEKTFNRIKEMLKKYNDDKLWAHSKKKLMDSYIYLKSRIDLLKNHKLSTYAGFKKSIDYDEMNMLIKKKEITALSKVIEYTFEDGQRTKELMDKLLYNAVVEGFAINKDLPGVFNSNPLKNFYDSGKRTYFMKMNTFRNRHDRSYKKHIDKLLARESPDEILEKIVKSQSQETGLIEGKLIYPDIFFNVFYPIIKNQPVTNLILEAIEKQTNPILKADLISKINANIHVMADKAKNWIESAGLVFGQVYEAKDIYKFLKEKDEKNARQIFFNSEDFELSRTSWIYGLEYGAKREKAEYLNLPVEKTILEINNRFAKELKKFRQHKFIGRTKKYFLTKGDVPGIKIGNIRAINLGGVSSHQILGILWENEFKYQFYGNMDAPKNKEVQKIVDKVVFNENDISMKDVQYFLNLDKKEKLVYRQLIKAITGIDVEKIKSYQIPSVLKNFKPPKNTTIYVPRVKNRNDDQISLFS